MFKNNKVSSLNKIYNFNILSTFLKFPKNIEKFNTANYSPCGAPLRFH